MFVDFDEIFGGYCAKLGILGLFVEVSGRSSNSIDVIGPRCAGLFDCCCAGRLPRLVRLLLRIGRDCSVGVGMLLCQHEFSLCRQTPRRIL